MGREAITWEHQADELFTGAHARIVETLEHPTSVSAGASNARVSAALAADVHPDCLGRFIEKTQEKTDVALNALIGSAIAP